VIAPTN